MSGPSRRRYLALASGGLAAGLAGCTDAIADYLGSEEEGEFLVVSTTLSHSPGYRLDEAEYPEDILARVSVENRLPSRQQGTLEIELRYVPDDGEGEVWTLTDQLDTPRGVSPTLTYVFESAYQPGSEFPDDYEISAEIVGKSPAE
jgi:hypothetical protein